LEKRENPLEGLTIGRGTYLRSLAKDPPIVQIVENLLGRF